MSWCVIVGAALTAPISFYVLRRSEGRREVAALGMFAGALTVAAAKCSALVMGEALGLLGGLALGLATAILVEAFVPHARAE